MLIELVVYELVTTIGGVLGLKALSGANVNKRLQSINKPKELPVIDKFLKRQLGPMSKREQYLSRKGVAFVNRISRYHAFRYLLVIAARRINEKQKNQAGWANSIRGAVPRRHHRRGLLAV